MGKKNTPGIHISRKGLFIWIGLIIFMAGWMFVLGIMVGRGAAPVNLEVGKLEKELADLKAKMLNGEQARASGKDGASPGLRYHEALTSSKREEPGKSLPKSKARPKPIPVPKPQKPPTKPKPAAKPAPKPVPKIRPETPKSTTVTQIKPAAPKTKPVARPEPAAPKKAPKGRFTIQVASVQDVKGAQQLTAKLRKKGYRAYQLRSEVAGKGVWYRVRVGAFEDRGEAGKILAKLKANKYDGMIVSTK